MNVDHIPELKRIQEKTEYIALSPDSRKVYYLEVIDKLKWNQNIEEDVNIRIEIGSLTWTYFFCEESCVLIEDNRYSINFDPSCFRLIEIKDIQEEEVFYRFKTEEEFRKEGLWKESSNAPYLWNDQRKMNKYLGDKLIGSDLHKVRVMMSSNKNSIVVIDNWSFSKRDFINIRYDDLTKYKEIKVVEEFTSIPAYSETESIKPSFTKIDDEIVIESTINITI